MLAGRLQGQLVTQGAKPRDHADGHVGHVGVSPEFLTGVDVTEMDFDKRDRYGQQRVTQSNARMGQRTGV
jgi:hypothetical protein